MIPNQIIAIPSFLTENINHQRSEVLPMVCSGCMSTCEIYCETGCEVCLNCESYCETSSCQSSCQSNCQSLCEKNCMSSCQTGSICQTTCESSCQTCLSCQSSCQSNNNHTWVYTAWGQISGYDGCVRYKYCSNSGCTIAPIEERKSHNYRTVGISSVCRRCSDCGKEDTSHNMQLMDECFPIGGNNDVHMRKRRCSKCGYIENWSTESHTYEVRWSSSDPAYCVKINTCTKCKYWYDEEIPHSYVNNICTNCGREQFPFPTHNFEWIYPKVKGETFRIGVDEYRILVDYINQKLRFFNKTLISKTTVYTGETVYSSTMNGVLSGLRRLNASGVPIDANRGDKITAEFLNKIRDCANSVRKS